jgi:hypothetical protein
MRPWSSRPYSAGGLWRVAARALGHHRRGACDRVGQIEVFDRRCKLRLAGLFGPPFFASAAICAAIACSKSVDFGQMRMLGVKRRAHCGQRIEGQLLAEHIRKGRADRPSLPWLRRARNRRVGHLHPALGVDVGRRFFRVRGAGRITSAWWAPLIAMGADIDGEAAVFLRRSNSSAPSRNRTSVPRASWRRPCRPRPARSRDRDRRRAPPRCAAPQSRSSRLSPRRPHPQAWRQGQHAAPSPRANAPCPMMIIGFLAL